MRESIKAKEFVVDGSVDRNRLYNRVTPLSEIPSDRFFWGYIRRDCPNMQRTYTRIAEITRDMKETGPRPNHILELKDIAIASHLNVNHPEVTGAGRITVRPLGVSVWEDRDGKSTKVSEVKLDYPKTSPRDPNPETSSFGNKLLKDMALGLMLKAIVDPDVRPKLSEKIFSDLKELGRGGSGNEVDEMMHSLITQARHIPGLHKKVLKNAVDVLAAIGETRRLANIADDQYLPSYVRQAAVTRLTQIARDPNHPDQHSAIYSLSHVGGVNPCDDLTREQSKTTNSIRSMTRFAMDTMKNSKLAGEGHRRGVVSRGNRLRPSFA
ncbi:MAG: hypothetical protein ABIG39_07775 [Candidatus Micrarchaeota archaeon]